MLEPLSSDRTVVETPEDIADQMEAFYPGAADGLNLPPTVQSEGLTDFVDLVLPELCRRGLFRTEYEGDTLRENLGLARPKDRSQIVRAPAYAEK